MAVNEMYLAYGSPLTVRGYKTIAVLNDLATMSLACPIQELSSPWANIK
jgi:hypothetical protein